MSSGKVLDLLKPGRFATVKDSTMAPYGIKKGDTIYIAGEFNSPVSEDKPYLLQKIFVCALVKDGHIDNGEGKGVAINPKRLVAVSRLLQETLEGIRDVDFQEISDEGTG